jgi:hypothetical protein
MIVQVCNTEILLCLDFSAAHFLFWLKQDENRNIYCIHFLDSFLNHNSYTVKESGWYIG